MLHVCIERFDVMGGRENILAPCLVCLKVLSFFTLSITSIFNRLHGVLNVGKKITNYTV
jgi:hypothetical protein